MYVCIVTCMYNVHVYIVTCKLYVSYMYVHICTCMYSYMYVHVCIVISKVSDLMLITLLLIIDNYVN